jgi:hypothetical protein
LHAVKSNTFLQLAKGLLIAFRAIAKGYQTPFKANTTNTMRDPRIACNTDNVSNITLGELHLKLKNLEASFKILFTIRSFLLMKVYPFSG